MCDPPRPGLEPMTPALAGGLSTTAPPGKPLHITLNLSIEKQYKLHGCNNFLYNIAMTLQLKIWSQRFHIKGILGEYPGGQWLGLQASTAGDPVLIPSRGKKILQTAQCSQKKKKYQIPVS